MYVVFFSLTFLRPTKISVRKKKVSDIGVLLMTDTKNWNEQSSKFEWYGFLSLHKNWRKHVWNWLWNLEADKIIET